MICIDNPNDNCYHLENKMSISGKSYMSDASMPVKKRLLELVDELIAHDGFGSIRVDIRLLKRGQKEVIIDCGKQYRFVVDFQPAAELVDSK